VSRARPRDHGIVAKRARKGHDRGTMRALVRGLLVLATMAGLLDGCVVVSDPDIQGQDTCVPFFLAHEADPSTSGAHRRPEISTDPAEFRASVPMRSCALTFDYETHVFVDDELVDISKIPPTGGEIRTASVLVDLAGLSTGCHRVELFVSTNFANFKTPERAGDLAKITWLVFNDPNADVSTCVATTP